MDDVDTKGYEEPDMRQTHHLVIRKIEVTLPMIHRYQADVRLDVSMRMSEEDAKELLSWVGAKNLWLIAKLECLPICGFDEPAKEPDLELTTVPPEGETDLGPSEAR